MKMKGMPQIRKTRVDINLRLPEVSAIRSHGREGG